MHNDDFMAKVALIVETNGLLRDYIDSVVIKDIKSRINDDRFSSLNSNHIHAALLLKAIAPCALKDFAAVMRLSKSAASGLVERMVENNVVLRQPNPRNRREIVLSVSPEFTEHVVYVRAELGAWFATLTNDLGMETFEKWHQVMLQLNTVILQKLRDTSASPP
jgi:DNA-binding MarR family transcriptional regulator